MMTVESKLIASRQIPDNFGDNRTNIEVETLSRYIPILSIISVDDRFDYHVIESSRQ
jgi:hypothetical protein